MKFATAHTAPVSRRRFWTGHVLSAFALFFLISGGITKVLQLPVAVEGTIQLGYPGDSLITLGVLELACVLLYLIPRTSLLGAIITTGYLGGAIATHVRIENPLFTHILFPVYLGLLIWGGLYLRDGRLRSLAALFLSRRDSRATVEEGVPVYGA